MTTVEIKRSRKFTQRLPLGDDPLPARTPPTGQVVTSVTLALTRVLVAPPAVAVPSFHGVC